MKENTDTGVPLIKKNKVNSRNLGYKDTSYVDITKQLLKGKGSAPIWFKAKIEARKRVGSALQCHSISEVKNQLCTSNMNYFKELRGFSGGVSGKERACQCRRHKRRWFNLWFGKIPLRSAWQPTPVFLPGESHGQRKLVGYILQGHEEWDTTEATQHTHKELRKSLAIL